MGRRRSRRRPDSDHRGSLVLTLIAGVIALLRIDCADEPHAHHRLLRQHATASSPATRFASSAFPSARSTPSNPSPNGSRSPSGSMTSTQVPADAKAAILSPSLVTARAIQLTPAYTGGPVHDIRCGDPAEPDRGAGGMGRSSPAAAEAHRDIAAHAARRREPAGRVRQHRRGQPARPRRQHP